MRIRHGKDETASRWLSFASSPTFLLQRIFKTSVPFFFNGFLIRLRASPMEPSSVTRN